MNKQLVLCAALMLCPYQLFSMASGVESNPNQQQPKPHPSLVQAYGQYLQKFIKPLPSYHLIAYDPQGAPEQNNEGFLEGLRCAGNNLIAPKINLPRLQQGPYSDQGPALEKELVQEVQTSIDEEARVTGELKSWKYFFRRIAGDGVLSQLVWWPVAFAINGWVQFCGAKPMAISEYIAYGAVFWAFGVITSEIHHKMTYVPDCYRTINAHRRHIKDQLFVSTAVAQRLKAHPKFQNNSNAARVIDAMTTPLAH